MWDFRRFAPKTGSREWGQVGDHLPIICDHMGQCGIPPFPVQSKPGLTPIREWCLFSLPLTSLSSTLLRSFNKPGDGRFLTIVHRTKCPYRMQWMLHAKTSQLNTAGVDKAYQKILPKMPCQRRSGVMQMRTCGQTQKMFLIRLHVFFILLWVFLFVYSHNKWQLYCIFL